MSEEVSPRRKYLDGPGFIDDLFEGLGLVCVLENIVQEVVPRQSTSSAVSASSTTSSRLSKMAVSDRAGTAGTSSVPDRRSGGLTSSTPQPFSQR